MTDKKDNTADSQEKPKYRCDEKTLKSLKHCIANGPEGIKQWNAWRKSGAAPIVIWLEGANLRQTHLEGVRLEFVHLNGANLFEAHLEGADLHGVHLESALLFRAHLENADLDSAHLNGANLGLAHLESANFHASRLEGADFSYCYLQDTQYTTAAVDGATCFWMCQINRWKPPINEGIDYEILQGTDFTGVALDNARIDPPTELLLEYNIRRRHWYYWLKKKNFLVRWITNGF